jgi:hypothetical protein
VQGDEMPGEDEEFEEEDDLLGQLGVAGPASELEQRLRARADKREGREEEGAEEEEEDRAHEREETEELKAMEEEEWLVDDAVEKIKVRGRTPPVTFLAV